MRFALQQAWLSRGLLARALWPLSVIFRVIVALRAVLYRLGILRARHLPVPVVVVGNLIAGGAGKTPAVLAVVSALQSEGWTPAIISRGYGRSPQAPAILEVQGDTTPQFAGDEPLLLRRRSGLPVFVGADRVAVARQALAAHPATDILVSDDGLQHRRLPRSAQVIVFDERGCGNGWLLPAGPLREPCPARPPAGSVVLYNAPEPSTPWPGHVARRRIAGLVSLPRWRLGLGPEDDSLEQLIRQGMPLLACAGIANPQRFFDMLSAAGLRFTPMALPDHHDYARLPWPADAGDVIVTEKDAVKLGVDSDGEVGHGPRIWVAPLDFECGPDFHAALRSLLPPPPPIRNPDGHPTPQSAGLPGLQRPA